MEEVIIKFVADTSGLKPAIDAMKALGQISEQDAAKIELINKATQQTDKSIVHAAHSMEMLSSETQELHKIITNEVLAGVAEGMADWAKETEKVSVKSKSLKQELKELKAQIAGGTFSGKELREMTKRAAELTDQLGDVNQKIKALSSDTKRIDAVVEGFRGLAAAGSVAAGAVGLFGAENEDLQKTLLKVQSAMAVLQGVQEISNLVTGEGILKTTLLSGAQKAAAVTSTALGISVGASLALMTGGLTILAGALIYFATTLDDTAEEGEKFVEKWRASAALLAKINDDTRSLIADGRKREIAQTKADYERSVVDLGLSFKKKEITTEAYNISSLQMAENYNKKLKNINERYDKEAADKAKAERDKILKAIEAENNKRKALMDFLKVDKNQAFLDEVALLDKELAAEREANEKSLKSQEDKLKAEEELNKKYADAKAKAQAAADAEALAQAKKLADEKAAIERQAISTAISTAQTIANAGFTILQNNRDAYYNELIYDLQRQTDAILANEDLTANQRAAIKEREERKIAAIKMEAWEQNKRAAIASALINGALAVTNAFATVQPFYAAVIAAAGVGVATAAQIAVIESQPTPRFAEGTEMFIGQGTGTSDSNLAYLSHGERVVPAKTNADYYPALSAIHNGLVQPSLANAVMQSLADGSYQLAMMDEDNAAPPNGQTLDMYRLAEIVKQGRSNVNITLDENGFTKHIAKHNLSVEYRNKKFNYKA